MRFFAKKLNFSSGSITNWKKGQRPHDTSIQKIAEYFDFAKYFTVLVGCGLDGSLPTKADVIEEVVRRLGAEKEKCLMVGDRKHDVEGAKIAGVDCVLLNVGYAEAGEADLCQPTYEWQDYAELLAKLG